MPLLSRAAQPFILFLCARSHLSLHTLILPHAELHLPAPWAQPTQSEPVSVRDSIQLELVPLLCPDSLFRCCFRMTGTTSPVPLSRQSRCPSSVLSAHTDLPLHSLASRTASSSSCLLISMCLDIPVETARSRSIAAWNHCCNNRTLIKGIPSTVNPNQSCVQTQGWISLACFRGMKNGDQHCKQHPEE